MPHRLLNLLTALSLLLCVAVCVLWVRSYLVLDQVGRWSLRHTNNRWIDQSFRGVVSSDGGLVVLAADDRQTMEGLRLRDETAPAPQESVGWVDHAAGWALDFRAHSKPVLGFERRNTFTGTGDVTLQQTDWRWLRVPYWFMGMVAITMPAARATASVQQRWARRRGRAGACPTCGYDLRASPDRCPECGTPAAEGSPRVA
jgi:hypothetical protein